MTCQICEKQAVWSWTDTHGVAQCFTCGTPYRIYHYEENKRVNKSPLIEVAEPFIPLLRQYWQEHQRRIPSQHSFPGGQELATREEHELFYAWLHNHMPTTPSGAP